MNPAEHVLRTLGRHLEGPAHVRLMGGGAMILGYGMPRATEDADLLLEDAELDLRVEEIEAALARAQVPADFAETFERTKATLREMLRS